MNLKIVSILMICLFGVLINSNAQTKSISIESNDFKYLNENDIADKVRTVLSTFSKYNYKAQVSLFKMDETNGGTLRDVVVVKSELIISVLSLNNDALLFDKGFTLVGSGKTSKLANRNMLNQLISKRKKYQLALQKDFDKIAVEDCNDLVNMIESLQSRNQLSEILAIYTGECPTAEKKVNEAWLVFQKENCEKLLLDAKSLSAIGKYEAAVNQLIKVDPQGHCKDEIEDFIVKLNENFKSTEHKLFELYKEYYSSKKYNTEDIYALFVKIENQK
jgi:hypothetical protein